MTLANYMGHSSKGVYPVMPRRYYQPRTDFQAWLNSAVDRSGISLTLLATKVGADYTHIWKIARGDPAKYPTSKRPGYELTVAIGEVLNDVDGALLAASYTKTSAQENAEEGQNDVPADMQRFVAGEINGKCVEVLVPRSATEEQLSRIRFALQIVLAENVAV